MIGYFNTYLQKYSRSQKQKTYTSLGLSLLLILLFIVLALRPTLSTVIELREKLHQGKEAAQKLDQKIENLQQAQVSYENVRPQLALLDAAVPPQPLVLNFMSQIDTLAKSNDLLLLKTQAEKTPLPPTDQPPDTNPTSVPSATTIKPLAADFSVEVKGEYPNLKKFVTDLTDLLRLINFKEISFSKEKGSTDLSLTIAGQVYFFDNSGVNEADTNNSAGVGTQLP